MQDIHQLAILPNQKAINSVAALSKLFSANQFEFSTLLSMFKHAVLSSGFMSGQDNSEWMATRGCNYIANPKLFATAPLTYVCVFIGELFNKLELEEIQQRVSAAVIENVLLRLANFKSV